MWRAGRADAHPDRHAHPDPDDNIDPGNNIDPDSAPSGKSTSAPNGVLGPYEYPDVTNTNGYNTYVGNNMWAAGGSG